MPPEAPPIDLSKLSATEFDTKLGELVRASLLRDGACVLVAKSVREITFLSPRLLDGISDDSIADALLGAWKDEEILDFLEQRERARRL